MSDEKSDVSLIKDYISKKLNVSINAKWIFEPELSESLSKVRPDIMIVNGNTTYIIEVKKKVTFNDVARMNLIKNLFNDLLTDDQDKNNVSYILFSKIVLPSEKKTAEDVGIQIIQLPHSIKSPQEKAEIRSAGVKLTSDKSWKIISLLIKECPVSIRQLSIKADVSYGWAHKVIQELILQGIAIRQNNLITIKDENKLLNGISWERPFENLFYKEFKINRNTAHEASQFISAVLKNSSIKGAFNGYTASGLYTNYMMRGDIAYMYLDKRDLEELVDLISEDISDSGNVMIKLYMPDRDMYGDIRQIENIDVVSPSQALLDVAGTGYAGKDLAKMMMEKYAAL